MSKQMGILWAVAVVLLALVWFTVNPLENQIRRDNPESGGLFPLDADRMDRVSIQSASASHELIKQDGIWLVASKDNYPADTNLVGRLIRATVAANKRNLVSQNPETYDVFEVTVQAGVSVEIGQGGATAASFVVGKSASEYASSYLRPRGTADVYLLNPMNRVLFVPTRGFRDRRMSSFAPEAIRSLQWATADTGWTLSRAESLWTVESPDGTGGEADLSEVQVLTQLASELKASGFAEGDSMDTGLAQPAYELVVVMTDGSEERVLIGNQDPSGQYYASRRGSDVIFLTSDWTLKQIRRRARGLLKKD